MGTWIQLILPASALLGLLLLIRGLFGRRVGTAPHCRTCRFDLTGLYPEHETCPECGADLTGPRATTRGLRRRRWKLAIVGLLIFAIPATLSVLAAQGLITKAKIAEALPTGALIALTIDRPDSWIAPEGRDELLGRAGFVGGLSPSETVHLSDALFRALSRPDFPVYRVHCRLLEYVDANPSTPPEVRQRYADFLLDRVVRTDRPWVEEWGGALLRLREQGVVGDDAWEAAITTLITPRLWCSSGEALEPGEMFLLRISYLSDRLRGAPGVFLERRESADGVSSLVGSKYAVTISRYGEGMPLGEGELGDLLVADENPSTAQFVIRSWYAEGMTDTIGISVREGLTHPSAITAETRLSLDIRSADPPPATDAPASDPSSIKQWLRARLLPAISSPGRFLRPRPRPEFDAAIAVLVATPEPTDQCIIRGSLVTISPDGMRTTVGSFSLEVEGSTYHSRWTGAAIRTLGGTNSTGRRPKQINLEIPEACLLPHATTRAVLLFDHVTLPDGRTFDAESSGSAPIEIELPLDPSAFRW